MTYEERNALNTVKLTKYFTQHFKENDIQSLLDFKIDFNDFKKAGFTSKVMFRSALEKVGNRAMSAAFKSHKYDTRKPNVIIKKANGLETIVKQLGSNNVLAIIGSSESIADVLARI